jgi:hypothetical protein
VNNIPSKFAFKGEKIKKNKVKRKHGGGEEGERKKRGGTNEIELARGEGLGKR